MVKGVATEERDDRREVEAAWGDAPCFILPVYQVGNTLDHRANVLRTSAVRRSTEAASLRAH